MARYRIEYVLSTVNIAVVEADSKDEAEENLMNDVGVISNEFDSDDFDRVICVELIEGEEDDG